MIYSKTCLNNSNLFTYTFVSWNSNKILTTDAYSTVLNPFIHSRTKRFKSSTVISIEYTVGRRYFKSKEFRCMILGMCSLMVAVLVGIGIVTIIKKEEL